MFGLAWSQRQEERNRFRLALGSFIEEYTNKVQIVQRNADSGSLERVGEFGACREEPLDARAADMTCRHFYANPTPRNPRPISRSPVPGDQDHVES